MRRALLAAFLSIVAGAAVAHGNDRAIQERIGFDQHPGAALPAGLVFRDSAGHRVPLESVTTGARPTILVLAWYGCRNLCGVTLRALARSTEDLPFRAGDDYRVVAVSIDPGETPADAAAIRRQILDAAPRTEPAGWHFLTGDADAIAALAAAVGFRYAYDADDDSFAHPAGLVLLTPDGHVARYLFGMETPARDLRLALVEAGRGTVGSITDRIALRCHRFDPETGQYSLAVMAMLRVAGGGTVAALAGLVGLLTWRGRRGRCDRRRRGAG